MAATDTTTLIVEMLQQMKVRNHQMEEQRRADLQAAQEQRLAAEEWSRRDMHRMLQESGLDERQGPHPHRRSILFCWCPTARRWFPRYMFDSRRTPLVSFGYITFLFVVQLILSTYSLW